MGQPRKTVPAVAEGGPATAILIVDDHPVFREGLSQIINLEADLEVRAQAHRSATAINLIERKSFDLVIVDIGLEGSPNGIELTKSIKATHPNLPVLVLSVHEEPFYADRALRAGANGYLMKREAPGSVIAAVRAVLAGQVYVSATMQQHLTTRYVAGGRESSAPLENLTDRELEILQLLGAGRDAHEIARSLGISAKTVYAHRFNLKAKLKMKSSREVDRYAVRWVNAQC